MYSAGWLARKEVIEMTHDYTIEYHGSRPQRLVFKPQPRDSRGLSMRSLAHQLMIQFGIRGWAYDHGRGELSRWLTDSDTPDTCVVMMDDAQVQ